MQYVDTLIVGMNSGEHSVNTKLNTGIDGVATLSNDSISITILGNSTNTTHLSSNINFAFKCVSGNCYDYQCVAAVFHILIRWKIKLSVPVHI